WIAGNYLPVIGAPVIAIILGVLAANLPGTGPVSRRLAVKNISGHALRAGIVLLGLTLNLGDVARTGLSSLALLAATLAVGLGVAWFAGRRLGVRWRTRCLIGIGTTICGASAIAALATVLRARTEEITYSISVIFLFN